MRVPAELLRILVSMGEPASVFISYSHHDKAYKERLATFLSIFGREELFRAWDDDQLRQGDDWRQRIFEAMDQAAVAVLLISADFLASPFIQEVEAKRLRQRREQGGLILMPVIVKPCPWTKIEWLEGIQAYPREGQTLSGADPEHDRELHYTAICEEILRYVVDQPRAAKEIEAEGEETEEEPERLEASEPAEIDGFYTRVGVLRLIEAARRGTPERVVEALLLLRTKKQRTWFVTTSEALYCVLDDARTRGSGRLVQWRQQFDEIGQRVKVRPSSRYTTLGLVDVGNRQNWLYSKSRHPDPKALEQRISDMIERSRER